MSQPSRVSKVPKDLVTQAEFARMMNVQRNQVTRWLRATVPMPSYEVDGKYMISIKAGKAWIAAGYRAGEVSKDIRPAQEQDPLMQRQAVARTELLEANSRRALAQAKRETGELVDRAAIVRAIQVVAIAIKTDLLEAPQSIADEIGAEFGVPVATVKAALDRKVRRLLNIIADGVARIG